MKQSDKDNFFNLIGLGVDNDEGLLSGENRVKIVDYSKANQQNMLPPKTEIFHLIITVKGCIIDTASNVKYVIIWCKNNQIIGVSKTDSSFTAKISLNRDEYLRSLLTNNKLSLYAVISILNQRRQKLLQLKTKEKQNGNFH